MTNSGSLRRPFSALIALVALLAPGLVQAQISAKLELSRKQYLAGEPVLATVSVTNYTGRDVVFASDGRMPWLSFLMRDQSGYDVGGSGKQVGYGKVKIRNGETLSRQVDLAQQFNLSNPGGFSVGAVVSLPDDAGESASTNRVLFNVSTGTAYWNQRVGIPGRKGQSREFKLISFSGESASHLYAQVKDVKSGRNVRTFRLGDPMSLRRPVAAVDRHQKMHVMFLVNPTFWAHCQVDTDGKVKRELYQRGETGDPQLVTLGDGTVRVINSVVYDEKAAAAQQKANSGRVRKASDRPSFGF